MGATRKITIEVSEEAASVLEGDPGRVRDLARLATTLTAEDVDRIARDRLIARLADPNRPGVSEATAAEILARWNAEGRS